MYECMCAHACHGVHEDYRTAFRIWLSPSPCGSQDWTDVTRLVVALAIRPALVFVFSAVVNRFNCAPGLWSFPVVQG